MPILRLFVLGISLGWVATPAWSAATVTVSVKSSKGESVGDAVVSLIPLDTGAKVALAPPSPPGEIVQEKQEFTSYVTVVQAGSKVVFPNHDTVQHHVYSLSKAKKFELPLYNPGQAESIVFDVSGTITLGCNIHDWMVAYLIVVPTPYFAKTTTAGTAEVSAPAGRYRLELQHPRLATPVVEELVLSDGPPTAKAFSATLKPDRRIRRGPDGKTSGYR